MKSAFDSSRWSTIRVLVVDDDPQWLRAVDRQLRRVGVGHVLCASECPTALQWMEAGVCDIVLSDMEIHGDSRAGLEIVSRARKLGLAVAVVSASAASEIDERLSGIVIAEKLGMTPDRMRSLLADLE